MTITNTTFLDACNRKQTDYTPLWLMRQAGRYMKSYRAIREKYTMLELCQHPDEVTRVTLLPIEEFNVDAAILFSDITMPFLGMKAAFDIVPGVGPVMEKPVRNIDDIKQLVKYNAEEALGFVAQSVKQLKSELAVPLIGFAGAPFTLAAYLIEGKPTRDFKYVRRFIYTQPGAWNALMELLTDLTVEYLELQIAAGVDAVQVFDSWVGGLHPEMYRSALAPHMKRLFTALDRYDLPKIHFGTGTATLLPQMKEAGGDVIGIDWKTSLASAWKDLNYEVAIQGNLDPAVLFAPFDEVKREVDRIFHEAGGRAGHIFNLGHGVWPETPEDTVKKLVEYVHQKSSEK